MTEIPLRVTKHKRVPTMDLREFVDEGILQEVNRIFFHPLGLALRVHISEYGEYSLHSILDYRDDPEGVYFPTEVLDPRKTHLVLRERLRHSARRVRRWGSVVQPVPQFTRRDVSPT
jgi:hypothetical protein